MARTAVLILASVALLGAILSTAHAQEAQQPPAVPAVEDAEIDFAADAIAYETETDVVTATGKVRMVRGNDRVLADRVVWDRKSGQVRAEGNVALTTAAGDKLYGDAIELTDSLKDGVVDNLLLVLADGARLAATRGERKGEVTTLSNAAYSPCPVVDVDGCPRTPSWSLSAVRIIHDPVRKRITFRQARLEMFGVPLFVIPALSQPLSDSGATGFLTPEVQYTRTNGAEAALPFYLKLADNRDLLLTPHIYSNALPALEGSYRALTANGAYRIGGFATYGSRVPIGGVTTDQPRSFRAYVDANGRFQLDPLWGISGSIRRVTDRTFLRRYDVSRDDRLRSTIRLERIDAPSYFSLTGWAVQTLRTGDIQGTIPVALPEVDYRRRFAEPLLKGSIDLQLNALALGRTQGQDTQRAFAGVRWDVRRFTNWGQEVLVTAYARGDIYHSTDNALTTTALYRGEGGYQARGIAALAAEVRWPFIGALFGGTQRLTPRFQLVGSPETRNLQIPNEDARSVDLEDSNLFALNRFPGYDRWEDGTRATVGLDWNFIAPGWSVDANIGQSFRLTNKRTLFPDGTGLTDRFSDIVGRTTVRFRNFVSVTHRFRLDKDKLQLRRNEIDATVGSAATYATIGYLKLNRNIGPQLEDLRDREEVRAGGRVQISRFISMFGAFTIDLTDRAEDPLSVADGYAPIRHRLGIAYTDECLDIGLTWRRDYETTGDARRGNSYLLRVAFRGLGR
ncbi:MAG: LPS-assembly protein LptD [Sphingomonadaceae bacterium]